MLFNLSIENVALIKKADVNFGTGFNVLTGETGAGKSILIGSVNMLLGERIGRDIIRNGENYAYVEGLFYLTPETVKLLETLDVTADEEGCLIVSRRLFLDGKNICKAGGKTAFLRPISGLRAAESDPCRFAGRSGDAGISVRSPVRAGPSDLC